MTTALTPGWRSTRKAKGDGHQRRGEILLAAERIFAAEGYQGATIRRIAEEVGVSSTALYLHFPDKPAILREICERTLRHLLDTNLEIATRPLDPVQRVSLMLEAYIRWGLAHANAYTLVYMIPRSISEMWSDGANDLSHRSYDIYRGVVREIAAGGRLRGTDADAAAQATWMACHGLVALLIARPKFAWAEQEDLIAVLLKGLIEGFVTG